MEVKKQNLPDFDFFYQKALREPKCVDDALPMVGVDECFNRSEIHNLCMNLLNRGLIRGKTDLWNKAMIKSDGATLNVRGGIRAKDKEKMQLVLNDIGEPKKYYTFPDIEIIEHSVVYLIFYPSFVLLSENMKTDEYGLRKLLEKLVKEPINRRHNSRLRYASIFKKWKTDINTYCNKVTKLIEKNEFPYGYNEYIV